MIINFKIIKLIEDIYINLKKNMIKKRQTIWLSKLHSKI